MTTPGPYADLISHAAKIIVEAKAQPHSAPAHWAGALWEAGMLVGPGVAPSIDDAESTSAALRRAEQERDWANDELAVRKSQLQAARYELSAEISAFKRMRDERDLARAELASARQELDAVRTARDNLDRQLGEARKHCAECRRAS